MKILLLTTIVILIAASATFAQVGGNLAVYSDPQGISCDLLDVSDINHYYVVHRFTHPPGVFGAIFKIETDHTGVLLGWSSPPFPYIGHPLMGISINYLMCLSPPILILEMIYVGSGTTPPCGEMRVVEHPGSNPPGLWAVDCSINRVPAQGYTSYINNDGSCPCTSPIPVQETTWGQVKALYR